MEYLYFLGNIFSNKTTHIVVLKFRVNSRIIWCGFELAKINLEHHFFK